MSTYIAAYDISHPRRRRKVARILFAYGTRVQQSVFEIRLDARERTELRRRIGPVLASTDEFELFPLDTRPGRGRVRWQRDPLQTEAVALR